MRHVVVIGASLAGLAAVDGMRRSGFDGRITVVDSADSLPPDRPPLSKQVLGGTMSPESATQPMAARLDDLDIELCLGIGATSLDAAERRIALSDGSTIVADGLVIATGATPRALPGALPGVYTLRTLEDSVAIAAELDLEPQRVVVVGAGFIGAEVAATCRSRGVEVTIVEAQERPMQRVMPGSIGDFVTTLHRDEGVDVRLGVGISSLLGTSRVAGVQLTDGTVIDADLVVAGIGVTPATGWLEGSGLELDDGVVCDETMLAAPGVVAAGDLARWPHHRYGEHLRIEQWDNAIEQGGYAGRRLVTGSAEPFAPVPWFWTDQYDCKLQLAGRVGPGDEVRVVDGSTVERRFVALFRRDAHCIGAVAVNRARHAVQMRAKLGQPLLWDDALAHFGVDDR